MLYLDYILYIIIIILLCILFYKVLNSKKEGFDHKGKGYAVTKRKVDSVIKSAQYGSLESLIISLRDQDSHWKNVMDVKPVLDKLIKAKTPSTMASNITFGGVGVSSSNTAIDQKVLLIKFINPNIKPTDSSGEIPENPAYGWLSGSWLWVEGQSISLDFGLGEPDPWWLDITEALYKIAELFAIMVIKMPYKFLNQLVSMGFSFALSLKDIMKPIFEFVNDMMSVFRSIFAEIFGWFKWAFRKWWSIMRDIPRFLRKQFKEIIKMIKTVVKKTFRLFSKFFRIIKTILKTIIKLPLKIFDLIEALADIIVNLFLIIIGIPFAIMNYIVAFQQIILDIMEKTPKIPFMDMFFS